MGAAVSDHPEIYRLTEYLAQQQINFSIASLRADRLDEGLVKALAASGQRTLTVAPEAGSKRMRDSINKGITEEHIYNAIELAAAAGMHSIKVYYMVGLPGEEDQDIQEMVDMILRLRAKMNEAGNRGELVVSVNGFVPKPFTPYQWAPLCDLKTLKRRFKMLNDGLKKDRKIKLITESLKETVIQAVLARGDRKIGEALLEAHCSGQNLKTVLKQQGIDMEALAERTLPTDAVLPWSHIDIGVRPDYLLKELQRSEKGQLTPVCFDGCQRCGVCASPNR